jgi:uncharacterized membrane-anchored protein
MDSGRYRAQHFVLCLLVAACWTGALAQAPAEDGPLTPEQQQAAATWQAAVAAMQRGPDSVVLRDQARLNLPEGFGFVPKAQATAIMEMMGNRVDDRFIGLVLPLTEDRQFFVTLDFEDAGYIKDDEAADWDADGLLQNLKDGTEAGNAERVRRGIDPIEVTRWIEPPTYNQAAHQLVWSAEAVLKNGDDPDPTINYNTYVLGREGFVSANLITTASTVEADRRVATPVLQAVSFNDGKRYEDFDSSTDKIAAYGLTALIGGLAAKKLGLFAVLAAFAVKFAKVIVVGVVAFGAAARRFLFGDKAVAK